MQKTKQNKTQNKQTPITQQRVADKLQRAIARSTLLATVPCHLGRLCTQLTAPVLAAECVKPTPDKSRIMLLTNFIILF